MFKIQGSNWYDDDMMHEALFFWSAWTIITRWNFILKPDASSAGIGSNEGKFQCIPEVWLLLIIPAVWLGTWNTFGKQKYSLCNDVMRILQMWNSMDGRQSVGNVWISPLQLLSFLHSYFNCGFTEIITFTLHGSFVIHCCSFVAFHSHCKRRAYSIAYSDAEKSCNNIVFLLTGALRMRSDMHISPRILCKTVLKEFNKAGKSIHLSWSIRSVFVLIKVKYPQSSTRALL